MTNPDSRSLPFGNWPSPITPARLANELRLVDAQWSPNGSALIWAESTENSAFFHAASADGSLRRYPIGIQLKGGLFYGGGEFHVGNTSIAFCADDNRVYLLTGSSGSLRPLTPAFGRVSSPILSPDERWLAYIHSDGENDLLAIVNTTGLAWPAQFMRGADFYTQPVWHPKRDFFAWCEWDHPDMPWQASRVKFGETGGMQVRLFDEHLVSAPASPASQPLFSPDGKSLAFITRSGDWDDLVILDLKSSQKRVAVRGDGFHLTLPIWVQGQRTYAWGKNGKTIHYLRYHSGEASLWVANLAAGTHTRIDTEPFRWLTSLSLNPRTNAVSLFASSCAIPKQLVVFEKGTSRVLASESEPTFFAPYASEPQSIQFRPDGGPERQLWFHPPLNPRASWSGKPPLLLMVHGGPTSAYNASFSPEVLYYTSRGYAVARLNYRGSTTFGYTYQDILQNNWGIVDVEDLLSAADALDAAGLVDGDKVALFGSSAGGFTVLNALIRAPRRFKAAVCSYPVTDAVTDAVHTHKFERFYNNYLIGDLQRDYAAYVQRSPLNNASAIQTPMAFFHGEDDAVVSPQQSVRLAETLRANGVPVTLRLYPGEGHGFKRPETILNYYQQVEDFLRLHLQ